MPAGSIQEIIFQTIDLLELAAEIPHFNKTALTRFAQQCRSMPEQIRAGCLNVAVVGVIKSGKSTFVNALAGKDLLQRGAGVVTAMTTRVRKGDRNQATVVFKSWDRINHQISSVLEMFPDRPAANGPEAGGIDIRREKDRAYLRNVHGRMISEFAVLKDEIRPETLQIGYALDGYETCSELVGADETDVVFSGRWLEKHRQFVSNPSLAFYVKDVCLEIQGKAIDANVEIADCQGTDSTDPSQIRHVLDYLETANLIIYCVSSRTGLRQSDVHFLRQISEIGRARNILLVNNCDLSEHENTADILKIENSIQSHLSLLEIDAPVFSFSLLYQLFSTMGKKLAPKNKARLDLWKTDPEMNRFCSENAARFFQIFRHSLQQDFHRLLLANHLEHLRTILMHVDQRSDITLDLLSSDRSRQEKAKDKISRLHENAVRLEAIVESSIGGVVKQLYRELEQNMETMFQKDGQGLLRDTLKHLSGLSVDVDQYRPVAVEKGFGKVFYLLFQDIRREIQRYDTETVRPALRQFAAQQEKHILDYFQSLFDSYQIDLGGYPAGADRDPENAFVPEIRDPEQPDMKNIKKILGVSLPEETFQVKYTSRARLTVMGEFGFHAVLQIFRTLAGRGKTVSFTPALEQSLKKIKNENIRNLKVQYAAFGEMVMRDYFSPLVDAMLRDFKEKIKHRFAAYQSYEEKMDELIHLEHSRKKKQKESVLAVKKATHAALQQIEKFDFSSLK